MYNFDKLIKTTLACKKLVDGLEVPIPPPINNKAKKL